MASDMDFFKRGHAPDRLIFPSMSRLALAPVVFGVSMGICTRFAVADLGTVLKSLPMDLLRSAFLLHVSYYDGTDSRDYKYTQRHVTHTYTYGSMY